LDSYCLKTQLTFKTEQGGTSSAPAPDLYFGCAKFDSCSGHRLPCLKFFQVFVRHSPQMTASFYSLSNSLFTITQSTVKSVLLAVSLHKNEHVLEVIPANEK